MFKGEMILDERIWKLLKEYLDHREYTRREESKYLECENRQLGLSAIATYIYRPPK